MMYLPILFFSYIGCRLAASLPCRRSSLNSIVPFYLSFDKKEHADNTTSYLFGLHHLRAARSYYFFSGLTIVTSTSFFCLKRSSANFRMSFNVMLLTIFS